MGNSDDHFYHARNAFFFFPLNAQSRSILLPSTVWFVKFNRNDNAETRARLPLAGLLQGLSYICSRIGTVIQPYVQPKMVGKIKTTGTPTPPELLAFEIGISIVLYFYFWRVCVRFTKQEIIDE